MSFVLKIFLKVLLCSIIVIVVKSIIGKIQEPSAGIKQTELGERFIDWKIFSNIYMIVGIGFTCILISIEVATYSPCGSCAYRV